MQGCWMPMNCSRQAPKEERVGGLLGRRACQQSLAWGNGQKPPTWLAGGLWCTTSHTHTSFWICSPRMLLILSRPVYQQPFDHLLHWLNKQYYYRLLVLGYIHLYVLVVNVFTPSPTPWQRQQQWLERSNHWTSMDIPSARVLDATYYIDKVAPIQRNR